MLFASKLLIFFKIEYIRSPITDRRHNTIRQCDKETNNIIYCNIYNRCHVRQSPPLKLRVGLEIPNMAWVTDHLKMLSAVL